MNKEKFVIVLQFEIVRKKEMQSSNYYIYGKVRH